MVYCVIWCHSRWRGRKNLKIELRALLCPAPGPAKVICWHTTTKSENAWWRPERYEASFSSRCDTVNLILQWPTQFQKLFVSLLHPVPGAESIVTRVWQCTTHQAKDSCWVAVVQVIRKPLWTLPSKLGTSSIKSICHLSTPDRQMVAQQPETKSSLIDWSFWRPSTSHRKEALSWSWSPWKKQSWIQVAKRSAKRWPFFLHFSWCICSLTLLHTVPKMHRQ